MKFKIGLVGLIFVGIFGWFIGSRLSPDAVGMAVGVLFGIIAGIPAALMVLASRRQSERHHEQMPYGVPHGQGQRGRKGQLSSHGQGHYMPQPPIIVFAGNSIPHQAGQPISGYQSGEYQTGGYPAGNQYFDTGGQPQQQLALPGPVGPSADRKFRMVGEAEEWIDSY